MATSLRFWGENMGLPDTHLPSDSVSRNLCSGQGRDIWAHVIRHVVTKEKVTNVKGNLYWSRCQEQAANASSSVEQEKRRMMDLVLSLRADIRDLDNCGDCEQQQIDERALKEVRERLRDGKLREVALRAFDLRLGQHKEDLDQEAARVGGRMGALAAIRRKARYPVSIPLSQSDLHGDVCPEPSAEHQALTDLRAACDSRILYLKSLYDSQNSETENNSDDTRSQLHNQWMGRVQGLLATHPPAHILGSLLYLVDRNKEEIVQLSATANVTKDREELRFALTSSQLQDVSNPRPVLRTIDSLIQECWRDCELRVVDKLRAVKRQAETQGRLVGLEREFRLLLQEKYGHSSELLQANREIFELQLDLVERKRHCQDLVEQANKMADSIETRNQEIQGLQAKHRSILDFQDLVERKQDHIRVLIKGNSAVKSHLVETREEIISFMVSDVGHQLESTLPLTDQLLNSVAREVKLFDAVSLPCLDRRVLKGTQRVPAHTLSLHKMDSLQNRPLFYSRLKKALSIPHYKATEHLLDEAAQRKIERGELQMLVRRQREGLDALQREEETLEDAGALADLVDQCDSRSSRVSLPLVRKSLDRCDRALNFSGDFHAEVQDWWEQPARLLVPWVTVDGLDVRGWVQKWNRLAQDNADGPRLPARRTGPRP